MAAKNSPPAPADELVLRVADGVGGNIDDSLSAPTSTPADDLVVLRVLEPIRHDGVDYAPGEMLEVTPAAARQLLASDAAELA